MLQLTHSSSGLCIFETLKQSSLKGLQIQELHLHLFQKMAGNAASVKASESAVGNGSVLSGSSYFTGLAKDCCLCFLMVFLSRSATVISGGQGQKLHRLWHILEGLQIEGNSPASVLFLNAFTVVMGVL